MLFQQQEKEQHQQYNQNTGPLAFQFPPAQHGDAPQGPVPSAYPVAGAGYPPPAGAGYPPPAPGYYPQPPGPGYYPSPGSGYLPAYGLPSSGPPITSQPGTQGWMVMPQGPPNCPAGLEYLSTIDQLLVHQKVELLEAFTGFETNNKFTIKNSLGQKVYYAREDNDCLTRCCCGAARPFTMKILDNYGNEVINMHRPLACSSCCCPCCPCCCPCCLETMEVSAPPGNVIGTIEEDWTLCIPNFSIKNASGDTVLRIEGPLCKMNICGDVKFKILTADGDTKVGKISKQWSGLAREAFTDADHFGITFPIDLDVKMKAVMLGACFLIDIMYFEKSGNDSGGGAFAECFAGLF